MVASVSLSLSNSNLEKGAKKMATATVEIGTPALQAQHDALRADIQRATAQLREAEQKLEAAREQRGRIAEGIARGTAKESDAARTKAEIESLELRIDGLNRAIAVDQPKLAALSHGLNHRAIAKQLAERREQFAALTAEGKQRAQRIIDKLADLMLTELPEFDKLKFRLSEQFLDLGGRTASEQLGRSFDQLLAERLKGLHVFNQGTVIETRAFVAPGTALGNA
jgi:chromosome segregation ATPase